MERSRNVWGKGKPGGAVNKRQPTGGGLKGWEIKEPLYGQVQVRQACG